MGEVRPIEFGPDVIELNGAVNCLLFYSTKAGFRVDKYTAIILIDMYVYNARYIY